MSHLVRNGADARRLLVPILDATDLSDDEDQEEAADELGLILRTWDEPAFVEHADRAKELLGKLDDLWSDDGPMDMLELGELRVPLHAPSYAIAQRCEQLKQTN